MLWEIGVGLLVGIALCWLALIVALLVVRPKGRLLAESLRLLPDLLRMLRRLAADPELSRGLRIRLGLLLAYLALPFDLIPDFIPVLGYADDAIIVIAVLRNVVRHVGVDGVRKHWPGTDDGFAALCELTRMKS